MTARTTAFCSSCGMENPIEARFCSTCGVAMGTVIPSPVAATTGPVREGLAGTRLQGFAQIALQLVALVTFLATILGMGTSSTWVWATRPVGSLVEVAHPAIGYAVLAVLLILLSSAFIRLLYPKRKDVGIKGIRQFRRTLREHHGIRLLLQPAGLRPGIILMSLMWIGMVAIAWFNLGTLSDQGANLEMGMWLALALPALGLACTVTMWPFSSETVFMERDGTLIRT